MSNLNTRVAPFRGFSRSDAFVLRSAAPTLAAHAAVIKGDIADTAAWTGQATDGPLPLPSRCDLRYLRFYVETVGGSAAPPSAAVNAWITTDAAGDNGITQKLDDVVWNVGMTSANHGWAAARIDVPYVRTAAASDSLYVWLWATDAAELTCRCDIYWDADELTLAHAGQLRSRG